MIRPVVDGADRNPGSVITLPTRLSDDVDESVRVAPFAFAVKVNVIWSGNVGSCGVEGRMTSICSVGGRHFVRCGSVRRCHRLSPP